MKLFLDDCNGRISGNGAPHLRLHGLLAGAEKLLDAQVMLDSFEKQLHRPVALVERADCPCRQGRVVGPEDRRLAGLGVLESNAPQVLRIPVGRARAVEHDALVTDDATASVDGVEYTRRASMSGRMPLPGTARHKRGCAHPNCRRSDARCERGSSTAQSPWLGRTGFGRRSCASAGIVKSGKLRGI